MVTVNGRPIYEALKPQGVPEWEQIGNKGKHGRWCVAEYNIPAGSKVEFKATANSKKPIIETFVAAEGLKVDFDGYTYGSDTCGWIVSI